MWNAKSSAERAFANYSQSKNNYNHLLGETSLAASDCKGPTKISDLHFKKSRKRVFAAKTKSRRLFLSSWICSSRRLPGEGMAALCHSYQTVCASHRTIGVITCCSGGNVWGAVCTVWLLYLWSERRREERQSQGQAVHCSGPNCTLVCIFFLFFYCCLLFFLDRSVPSTPAS